ncbi:unnamed protein product [Microthlaspi erraticum]|uniref:pectinesterase n=1 Tax=Microthlaspi erraticum TaxID=1685480 RepID=A0A6D2HED6_9BRAS|nr:unnamed protein product [Microthlaspi erraticum]CAA7028260.1 unnamed protein product [Microthlaspi erraticum]
MKSLICLLTLSSLYLTATSSRLSHHRLEHKTPKDFNEDIVKTVVVGQNGSSDFKTIQAAIDSIPSGNDKWIKISLQNGIYNEKIIIPSEKQKIVMQGNDASKVIVQYNDAGQSNGSGPVIVYAQYFVAINITFKNSYDPITSVGVPYKEIKVAPSIILMADKAWFYGCSFISVQDTLADLVGRHLFQNCYIEGAIDFIWGGGQSIYKKCLIYVKGMKTNKMKDYEGGILPGFITAQGRASEQDTSGFVFKYCVITGDGMASLGRAYRGYSRVLFYKTSMSNIIVPQGWDAWFYKGQEDKITFAEVGCIGEGANKQGRVGWEKSLSAKDVAFLTSTRKFIDGDGWMATLPSSLVSLDSPFPIYY